MANFAKIGLNGKVLEVQSVNNSVLLDSNGTEQEQKGIDFLTKQTNWPIWVQCSYNTRQGVHITGGTPFRKNYPGVGYIYDEDNDAFIPKKPHSNFVLNETTGLWEPPVAYPDDGNQYRWDFDSESWVVFSQTVDNS